MQRRARLALWQRWRPVLFGTFSAFTEPDMSLRCAGTAFFGFLSLFVLFYGLIADRSLLEGTVDIAASA